MKINYQSEGLSVEKISNYINDLKTIDSFFILERGDCSYLQCISYKGVILIEERIYSGDNFKHYILGHDSSFDADIEKNIKVNIGNNTDFKNNELIIEDKFFKRFSSELFTISEAVNIFTDYYTKIPFEKIAKRDVTNEFPKLEKGFVFIKWLESAVDSFVENLAEFIEMIEPFIIDELKKDCIGRKIDIDYQKQKQEQIKTSKVLAIDKINKKQSYTCSAFKVIDIYWAVQSIIEVAEKYEFLGDFVLYKKNNIEDNKFFRLNIDDFK